MGERFGHSPLTVWLLRLGVRVWQGRPYPPETQREEERFHRTLEEDLRRGHPGRDLAHGARKFARFRQRYNDGCPTIRSGRTLRRRVTDPVSGHCPRL